jgi:hypothetical protein
VLHFRLDDLDFLLDDATVIDLEQGPQSTLLVRRNRSVLHTWTYVAPVLDPPLHEDPTPFVEDEDFDFGLFVHNVTNSARRRAIYRANRVSPNLA